MKKFLDEIKEEIDALEGLLNNRFVSGDEKIFLLKENALKLFFTAKLLLDLSRGELTETCGYCRFAYFGGKDADKDKAECSFAKTTVGRENTCFAFDPRKINFPIE